MAARRFNGDFGKKVLIGGAIVAAYAIGAFNPPARKAPLVLTAEGPNLDAPLGDVRQGTTSNARDKLLSTGPSPYPGRDPSVAKSVLVEGSISINSATAQDLDKLPGVGPATAANIIAYREGNGKFHQIDELMAVKGIGAKKFEKMRRYLKL